MSLGSYLALSIIPYLEMWVCHSKANCEWVFLIDHKYEYGYVIDQRCPWNLFYCPGRKHKTGFLFIYLFFFNGVIFTNYFTNVSCCTLFEGWVLISVDTPCFKKKQESMAKNKKIWAAKRVKTVSNCEVLYINLSLFCVFQVALILLPRLP